MLYKLDRNDVKVINNNHELFRIVYLEDFNAGGIKVKKFEEGGYISDDVLMHGNVYVDKHSIIYGNSEIGKQSHLTIIEESMVVDSDVSGGNIRASQIINSTVNKSHIHNSIIRKSEIISGDIRNSRTNKSLIISTYCMDCEFYDAIIKDFHIVESTIKYSKLGMIGLNSNIIKSTVLSLTNKSYINLNNAVIDGDSDLLIFDQQGSRRSSIYFYTDYSRNIRVSAGCFHGTLKDFEKRILIKYFSHNTEFMKYFVNYTKCIEIVKSLKPTWKYEKINIFMVLYYRKLFYFSDEQTKANKYIEKYGL